MTALKFYKTHGNINAPKFQTEQSACFDIEYNNAGKHEYKGYSSTNSPFIRYFDSDKLQINPKERMLIPTGLILDIPVGYSVRVHPRSGMALSNALTLINAEGVIDSDYVEELYILVVNESDSKIVLHNGDRIAQAELVESVEYTLSETKDAPKVKTSRKGGMGSTGTGIDKPTT